MDGFSSEVFEQFVQNDGIDVIGAMGKRSKTLAEQHSIAVDISSGVIDRAILMALCGKRCVILTNGGMIPHSLNRINEYVDRSGIAISVSVANPQ